MTHQEDLVLSMNIAKLEQRMQASNEALEESDKKRKGLWVALVVSIVIVLPVFCSIRTGAGFIMLLVLVLFFAGFNFWRLRNNLKEIEIIEAEIIKCEALIKKRKHAT